MCASYLSKEKALTRGSTVQSHGRAWALMAQEVRSRTCCPGTSTVISPPLLPCQPPPSVRTSAPQARWSGKGASVLQNVLPGNALCHPTVLVAMPAAALCAHICGASKLLRQECTLCSGLGCPGDVCCHLAALVARPAAALHVHMCAKSTLVRPGLQCYQPKHASSCANCCVILLKGPYSC